MKTACAVSLHGQHVDGRHLGRVDVGLGGEALAGDIDLEARALVGDEAVVDEAGGAAQRVHVLHVAQTHVLVEREAEGGRRGGAAVDAVAVDGLAAPRPGVGVDVVVVEQELHQLLPQTALPLSYQRRVPDEAARLQAHAPSARKTLEHAPSARRTLEHAPSARSVST